MAEGAEVYLRRFCASSGLPQSEADLRPDRLQREIQIAQRDMFLEVQKHNASLERYDFTDAAVQQTVAVTRHAAVPPSITLAQAVDDYIAENKRAESWQSGTFDKKLAALRKTAGGARDLRAAVARACGWQPRGRSRRVWVNWTLARGSAKDGA